MKHLLFCFCLLAAGQQAVAQSSEKSPPTIEAIECRGNQTTSCEFIQRKLQIETGTVVDDDAVQEAQLRLSALAGFESVRVHLEKGSGTGKALLVVDVVEASPIVLEFGLGAWFANRDYESPGDYDITSSEARFNSRVSNQNLFGNHKIGSVSVVADYLSDETTGSRVSGYQASSRNSVLGIGTAYIDPNLFGSERFFLSIGAGYTAQRSKSDYSQDSRDPTGSYVVRVGADTSRDIDSVSASLSLGYRLWSYSYLTGRYAFNYSESKQSIRAYAPVEMTTTLRSDGEIQQVQLGFGWDSEDDAYFPRQGWRASISGYHRDSDPPCDTCEDVIWIAAVKSNWTIGNRSVITLGVGEPDARGDELRPASSMTPGDLKLTYSYVLDSSEWLGGTRRGRWYAHVGTGPFQLRTDGRIGGDPDQAHVTLGLRIESRVLGLVDLWLTGSRYWPQMN